MKHITYSSFRFTFLPERHEPVKTLSFDIFISRVKEQEFKSFLKEPMFHSFVVKMEETYGFHQYDKKKPELLSFKSIEINPFLHDIFMRKWKQYFETLGFVCSEIYSVTNEERDFQNKHHPDYKE